MEHCIGCIFERDAKGNPTNMMPIYRQVDNETMKEIRRKVFNATLAADAAKKQNRKEQNT